MTRLRSLILAATVALALGAATTAIAATHLNAYALQSQFFCTTCHEPLNQVNSPQAQEEKDQLQQLVNRGLDLKQIKTAMVEYYGEDVLASPPAHGINLLVYILPPLFLLGGLGLIAYNLPRWRRRAQARASTLATANLALAPNRLDADDARRLDEELSHFDG